MSEVAIQDYIEDHFITKKLQSLGVTDEQLNAMRFRSSNIGVPFEFWSFSWLEGTAVEAVQYIKSYCALKWILLDNPPPSQEKSDAARLVSETVAFATIEKGITYSNSQSKSAKHLRVIVNNEGQTIGQLIDQLIKKPEYCENSAKELWPHFLSLLDTEGLGPEEIEVDKTKLSVKYDFKNGQRSMSFQRFSNIISEIRKKNSR